MPTFEGPHRSQQGHRRQHFPPQDYHDLTKADITQLAPILAHPPPPQTSASAAFDAQTRTLIHNLPPRLRSKLPCLSTLCSSHRKLSSHAIVSLWMSMKRDVLHELDTLWRLPAVEGRITQAQAHFITQLTKYPWHDQTGGCAACSLSRVAGDNDLLIAIGAVTIATLSPNNWKKSKRVYFLECLLHGRVDPSHADGPKRKMFELGSALRRLREEHRDRNGSSSARPHVEESVARYYADQQPYGPPEPPRSPQNLEDVRLTTAAPGPSVHFAQNTERYPSAGDAGGAEQQMRSTTTSQIPARKPLPKSARSNVFSRAFQGKPEEQSDPSARIADDASSSQYSVETWERLEKDRHESGTSWVTTATTTITDGDAARTSEILDLYRHSAFPAPGTASPPPAQKHYQSPPNRPATPYHRTVQSELARYPTQKLAPIWIPKNLNNYGTVPPALQTSVLWKRRSHIPQLRVGHDGDLKGPFDPGSELGHVEVDQGEDGGWI